jgi:membrane protein
MRQKINMLYEEFNRALGGVPEVVKGSFKNFQESGGPQAAAALSYYLLFSIFPLLLASIVISSFVLNLNNEDAFNRTVRAISQAIPVSTDVIVRNLRAVLDRRNTVSLIGLLSALWSASGAFRVLSHNVNGAWDDDAARSFVGKRLMGVAMVGVIVLILLVLSLAFSTLPALLPPRVSWFGRELSFRETWLWSTATRVMPLIFSALMYFALYRWVPKWHPDWRSAAWSAVSMAVLWELAKFLFERYIRSGFAAYEMVYGSLGAVVALLFWAYISAIIVLFGAYLTARLERQRRQV